MESSVKKVSRRRLAGAYISSIISIALVLVLVGVGALLSANARSVSNYFKEHLLVSVLLTQEATQQSAEQYETRIKALPFIHSTRLVTKEEGTEELKAMLGDDFLQVFESSPVPYSVELTLNAAYVHPDSLQSVIAVLSEDQVVDEVSCQQSLVEALNANITRITLILLVFIGLMLFISLVLIGNVMRISVFSNRFSIHTMKLVGATASFIRAPYLRLAAVQGLAAALIALLILGLGVSMMYRSFPQLFELFRRAAFIEAGAAVVVGGVAICLISTYFTVNKLISMKRGDLYF